MTSVVASCLLLAAAPLPPKKPARATAEDVLITGTRRHAAGGGLIKRQTEARALSAVSSEFISKQSSLQNAYQYVALTPGANVQTTDPYGLSEEGSLNIRGLGQDEIGYVLEGMPLNDIGFYTAYPSQFIDSENIDEITLAQGATAIDTPAIGAAGGVLNITMLDPALSPGGSVALSAGSYHADREYLRLDSGLLGDSGARGFISFSHTGADNWRGPGRDKRTHIDFKFVKEWSAENRISLVGTYHDGITTYYPLPTRGQFQQYGAGDANNLGQTYIPGSAAGFWPLYVGTWRLLYLSAPTQIALGDNWKFAVTPYWQYNYGNTPTQSALSPTGNFEGTQPVGPLALTNVVNGAATVMANYQDRQYRAGLTPKFTYASGSTSVEFGAWLDYADEQDIQSYSALSPQGLPGDLWADTNAGLISQPNGQLFLAAQDHVETKVAMVYADASLKFLGDTLTLDAGFKEASVTRNGTNGVPGPQYRATVQATEALPRFAISYQPDRQDQFFAAVVTNFRTPSEADMFTTYANGAIATPANNVKTEYAVTEEAGYRYSGKTLTVALTAFNADFTHRQVATVVGGSLINESIDAGGQNSRGIDAQAGLAPWRHWSPYASAEFLDARLTKNLPVQTASGAIDRLPTAGKIAIRSPRLQAAAGLSYDDGDIFGTATVKYTGAQYATFLDDEHIPAHAQADFSLGWRLPLHRFKARPELRLNVINVTDANFLAGVAAPTTSAHGITGAAPTYYIAGGLAAIVTLRQSF